MPTVTERINLSSRKLQALQTGQLNSTDIDKLSRCFDEFHILIQNVDFMLTGEATRSATCYCRGGIPHQRGLLEL